MKAVQIISFLLIISSVQQSQALGLGITDEQVLNLIAAVDEDQQVLFNDLALQQQAIIQADESIFYYLNTVTIVNQLDEASAQQLSNLLNALASEYSYSPESHVTLDEIVVLLSNLANNTNYQNLTQIIEIAKDEAQIVDNAILKAIQASQVVINDFNVTSIAIQVALNQTIYVANSSLNSFAQQYSKENLDEAVLQVLDENFYLLLGSLQNISQVSIESWYSLYYADELVDLLAYLTSNQNMQVVQLADDPQNLSIALQVDKVLVEANLQASQIYYLILAAYDLVELKFLMIEGDFLFGSGIYKQHFEEGEYGEYEEVYIYDELGQGQQSSDEYNVQVQNQSGQNQSVSSIQGSDAVQNQTVSDNQVQDESQQLSNVQDENQSAQNQSAPVEVSDEQQNIGNQSEQGNQEQPQNDENQSEQGNSGSNDENQSAQNESAQANQESQGR